MHFTKITNVFSLFLLIGLAGNTVAMDNPADLESPSSADISDIMEFFARGKAHFQRVFLGNAEVEVQSAHDENSSVDVSPIIDANIHGVATPEEAPLAPVVDQNEMQSFASQDNQINANDKIDTADKQSSLYSITWLNKKQALKFGIGAVALITVGYVTYVLYKNGTLKNVAKVIKNHPYTTAGVVSTVAGVAGYLGYYYYNVKTAAA